MIEIRTTSPDETLALGRLLATHLATGDVILLSGRLGCGKTVLAAGIAEGLGVEQPIVSPSFVIVRSYLDGFLPLFHADVYRLGSMAEFDDLELVDAARQGVLLIEWGEAVGAGVPEDHLLVRMVVDEDERRLIRFYPAGSWEQRQLELVV